MANRWCDGFGRYGGNVAYMLNGSSGQAWAQVDTSGGGWALSSAHPRTGNWHLRMTDGIAEPQARRVFGDPLTEAFFGNAFYFSQLPQNEVAPGGSGVGFWLASFRDEANGYQLGACLGTDGAVAVYRVAFGPGGWANGDFTGVLLGRSAPCVGAGAYQHFEHYVKVGNSGGAYELRVDEVTVLNLTGIDTDNGGGEVSQVVVGRSGGAAFGNTAQYVDMADCFVNDTVDDGSGCSTFVGDVKSGLVMVNANTAQADFALSAGSSGYALLNGTPPDDSTYISTAATTAESDFGLADGPANLTEILTCRPFIRAMKNDAGTCTVAPSMKTGSSKAVVSGQPITTAFAYYDSNVPNDPATGVPWTLTGLNAALEVVERTA
jgi:hypothetical protein